MKKKILATFLTMAMVISCVAGCGSSDSKDSQAKGSQKDGAQNGDSQKETTSANDAIANLKAATEGTVKLTLWCDETPEYQETMKKIVDNFKNEYSDIDFDITIGSESVVNTKEDVLSDPEAAADVFVMADDQLKELVDAGALQCVDTTYTYNPRETNEAITVDAASIDGKLYAYPMTASNGYFLFYNKNLLSEEDVASWDNLLAAAEKQGKTVGMEVSGAWYMYGFFAGAGLEMQLGDDGKNVCNWNATTLSIQERTLQLPLQSYVRRRHLLTAQMTKCRLLQRTRK